MNNISVKFSNKLLVATNTSLAKSIRCLALCTGLNILSFAINSSQLNASINGHLLHNSSTNFYYKYRFTSRKSYFWITFRSFEMYYIFVFQTKIFTISTNGFNRFHFNIV